MDNPLITLIVCSYNQEAYVKEALDGALSQTYSPMEIIFSDDCSTDNTFDIMQEYAARYQGPHTLILNQNPENLGLIGHVNKVLGMAKGDIIIGSAGDDICLPHRAETIAKLYKSRNGAPTLFHGNVLQIGPKGEELGLLEASWGKGDINLEETATRTSLYIGASSTFTRSLLDLFPEIQQKNAYEDLIWGFRAAITNSVVFIEEPLIKYRVGVGISWHSHKPREISEQSLIDAEIRRLEFHIDMLKQRDIDLRYINNSKLCSKLSPIFNREIIKATIKLAMLKKQLGWLTYAIHNPRLLWKAIQWQRKFRKRTKRRAKRGY